MNPVQVAGARLALERMLRGWTQKEAASRAGIGQPDLSRLENGRTAGVAYATVAQVAAVYGLSVAPHSPAEDPALNLTTSGRRGAYREIVGHLNGLREQAGESAAQASRRAGRGEGWWRKLRALTGPAFDTVNTAAAAYGYRLALVPIEEEEEPDD